MSISQNFQNTYPGLNLNFALEKTLDPRVSFSRASTGTYIDPTGTIQTAGVNTPRFTYDPVTGKSLGLLVEESRTNLWYPSIDNNMTGTNGTLTQNNDTAPDGTFTATTFVPVNNTSVQRYVLLNQTNTLNLTQTVSFFTKTNYSYLIFFSNGNDGAVQNNVGVNVGINLNTNSVYQTTLANGAYYSTIITTYSNNWKRISITYITAGGISGKKPGIIVTDTQLSIIQNPCEIPNQSTNYNTDGIKSVSFWGFQIETATFPTSYIPTTSSTVTRSADITQITSTNFSNIYNSNGGGLSVVATPASQTQNRTNVVTIGSGNTNYAASITLLPGANGAQFRSTNSNIAQVDFAAVGSGVTETKVSANFNTGNFIFNTNSNGLGTTSIGIGVTTTATVGTATTITIGGVGVGTNETFNGTIRSLSYYPNTLTTTQVNNLSASNGNVVLGNNQFAFTVRITTPGTTYTLLTNNSGTYNYNVDWGDGTVTNGITTNNPTRTYANAGVYVVKVTLNTGSFYFYNNGDTTQGPRVTGVVGTGSSFGWNSNLYLSWWGCSNLTSFPKINTSNVTNFGGAWYNCSSLTSFPQIDTSNATTFNYFGGAWYNCSSLTSFPLLNTSNVTNFNSAWYNCSSLTSFPLLNTSNVTNFYNAWQLCTSLTSFPLLDSSKVTDFTASWAQCTGLTTFPTLNTSSGTIFTYAWQLCTNLTSFPQIDTSKGTTFNYTWQQCKSLTSFPTINLSSATSLQYTWDTCTSLTSFPGLGTTSVTNFTGTWNGCSSLTSFPQIDTSNGTNFLNTWQQCKSLTSFPTINLSKGTNFNSTWYSCTSLTSFPAITFGGAGNTNPVFTGFVGNSGTWQGCTNLSSFPANAFNACTGSTSYNFAWTGCALTATSIENILTSIVSSGATINTPFPGNIGLNGGTNAAYSTWTPTAQNALSILVGAGWTVSYNTP